MAVRLSRWLALAAFSLLPMISAVAQVTSSLYDSAHTYREVTASADGCPTANHLCHYHPGMNGWGNSSPEKEYNYRGMNGSNVVEFMNWRMVFPRGYKWDHSVKYPMIIMLHGSGESGRIGTCCFGTYAANNVRFDNNDHHLLHGGREHQIATGYSTNNGAPNLPVKFPGIVVWPQSSYNASWEAGYNGGVLADDNRMAAKIIDWIITHYDVDPDRISVHGLSSGARGTWDLATKRPDLFASILPMSGVANDYEIATNVLVTTPVWLFQGGLDTNPNPGSSQILIDLLNSKGGNGTRTLYPTLAHGTWQTAYAEANFFPFILAANKKNIHVFGGDPSICIGGSVRLGFSAGFTAYQWTRNGVDIPGANSRFHMATQTGAYAVRYTRVTDGSVGTSFATNVTSKGVPCVNVPPTVNAGVDQSLTLPIPQLQLSGTASDTDGGTIASYLWTKVSGPAVTMTNAATATVTLTNLLAGTYVFQLRVTDNGGAPATDQVMITVSSGGGEREYDVNLTWAWNLVGGAWNDFITTGGGVIGNSKQLSDVNGSSSGITISVSSAFVDGTNNHGVNPGIYPNNAMTYFLRATTTKTGSLKLTGLNLSNVYDLSILSSNADVWYPSDTRLTVAGQTATINARANADQLVTFSALTPSAAGELTITVAPATTNATNIGVINALVIKERPLLVNMPPVVNAGPDVTVDLPLTQWQVTGTATDGDGTINLRQWTKVSGPAATVSDSGTGILTLTNIIAGTYVFQFAGRDNSNATVTDQMTLTVNPGIISPPVVNAGPDQTVMVPLSQLQLPGSVIDADGFILSQLWTKVSGPSVTLSNASTSTLTLTNITAGTYVFQLSAQDNSLSTSTDQMTLIANVNQPPAADAGPDVTVDLPLTEWQVTGTAIDGDGTVDFMQWSKVSGPPASVSDSGTGTLTLTNIIAGTYVFQFAARDNGNLTSTDQMTLTVNPGVVIPPLVNAGADQTVSLPLAQLQLPGSASDTDGFLISQLWTKVSGPAVTLTNAATSTLTLSSISAGTYVFQLSAEDNSLGIATDQVTVVVNPNLPPVVNAGPDQQVNLPLAQLQLTGTATDEGSILSVLWTKVSGPAVTMTNATTPTVTLTGLAVGTYIFQFAATDNGTLSANDQVTVIVSPTIITGAREFDINITWQWNQPGGSPWNDFITTGGGIAGNTMNALVDKNGNSSTISIVITTAFVDGVNNHGVVPGSYPNNVMQYFLRSTQARSGALKLAGLNLSKQYDVSILSSNTDVWYPSDTRLTVRGVSSTVNARSNAGTLVNFPNVVPTAAGEIPIVVAPATSTSTNIGVINAIILTEHDAPIGGRFMTPDVAQAIPDDFVRVYPNAIDDHVIVEINPTHASPDHYQIEFTDMRGISLHHLELKSPGGDFISERIPAEFLQAGIYIVAIHSQQNGTRYFKVVKR